jgi:hypothetical protein
MEPARMLRFLCLVLLGSLLAGCDQQALFEKLAPKEESALAKALIDRLAARDIAAIEARLDPALKTPESHDKLLQMAEILPSGPPRAILTVAAQTRIGGPATTYNLAYEYEYPDAWVLANVVLERRDGQLSLQGIHVARRPQSLARTNRFTFEDKGWSHYAVFALAVSVPIFIVYALVACARTPLPRRKWLWMLFIAVGLVQLQFNWSDGAWDVLPLSFLLLGAGFTQASPVAPVIFGVAFPLGAAVFLARRRALRPAA